MGKNDQCEAKMINMDWLILVGPTQQEYTILPVTRCSASRIYIQCFLTFCQLSFPTCKSTLSFTSLAISISS